MELKSLLTKDSEVEIEYPGLEGFKLNVAYLSRDAMLNIRKKCTVTKFNKKTRQPEEEVDDVLFSKVYTDAVIKGWSGLKYKYLKELVPVDLSAISDTEKELVYTPDNASELIKNSIALDSWLGEVVSDVENFNKT